MKKAQFLFFIFASYSLIFNPLSFLNSKELANNHPELKNIAIKLDSGTKKEREYAVQQSLEILENKDYPSLYYLGVLFWEGKIVKKNMDMASTTLGFAANNGYEPAILYIGSFFYEQEEWDTAIEYLQKIIDTSGEANFIFGKMYLDGLGVKENVNTAIQYLKKAISLGYFEAKQILLSAKEYKNNLKKVKIVSVNKTKKSECVNSSMLSFNVGQEIENEVQLSMSGPEGVSINIDSYRADIYSFDGSGCVRGNYNFNYSYKDYDTGGRKGLSGSFYINGTKKNYDIEISNLGFGKPSISVY